VSEAPHGFVFDSGACKCQSINAPLEGSRYGGGEHVRPSSEAEPHPGGRPALERRGTSPQGATGPRASRKFASAVMWHSSEAEFRPRVAGPTVRWAAGATRAVGPTIEP
jgi:hypothetical protein